MTETLPRSFLPKRLQILSGSSLKMIAIITMLIDHVGVYILSALPWANRVIFIFLGESHTIYSISRDIGRIAFPIYCFLLVEGYMHTSNRVRYGCNLLTFAIISEIPWNYAHSGTLYYGRQNVFFTLFLGYLAFCAIGYFREQQIIQIIALVSLAIVSSELGADYGWAGYVFLLIMYGFRYEKVNQAVVGSCWLSFEWKACFAFPIINMYNGKRGFIRGKAAKYAFYAFYPLHIAILGYIKYHYLT